MECAAGCRISWRLALALLRKIGPHVALPVVLFVVAYFGFPRLGQDIGLLYRVRYDLARPSFVHVSITLSKPDDGPLTLIVPRSVPGGYAQRPYDPFIRNVQGLSTSDTFVEVRAEGMGPRWSVGAAGDRVRSIEYDVDVAWMEREILAASDSSKIRDGYVGLLGYSILAIVEGRENQAIELEASGPAGWPIFLTLAPQVPVASGAMRGHAADFYALADSQILMGPKMQVRRVDGGVPLFLSAYVESDADLGQEAALAREALDKVITYFGGAPFANYTVALELLKPISERHEYNFSMEHLNSGTFYLSADRALTAKSSEAERETHRFNYAHHMAHSWIPKRAYGEGYLPFQWEMAPVSDTIWFNEGFGRYVAIEALADAMPKAEGARYRKEKLVRLQGIVDSAPEFMRRMSLAELSREGSFLYSEDFRTGMNLFSRGALMAAEMDDAIRTQSGGEKSLRDALRHLVEWSVLNHRAFRVEELPEIFREATGVDVKAILDRDLQPLEARPATRP
jgi:predicted metalloprotease with PDZ domain